MAGFLPNTLKKIKALDSVEQYILGRYSGWLNKRIPPQREITLLQNNIFIYPIWQCVYFFIVIAALWIAATNYENNLAFALSFLLISIFVVCIHRTYNNLAGLSVASMAADPVFLGEYAEVAVLLKGNKNRSRDSIQLYWDKDYPVRTALNHQQPVRLKIPVKTNRRGLFRPHRLTIDTVYPLGIIRSVSYLDLDIEILVYPKPCCFSPLTSHDRGVEEGEHKQMRSGSQEFNQLSEYQPGASLKQLAWKQYAKGQDLMVKQYGDYTSQKTWLQWDAFPTLNTEERLSNLCYWALELDKKNEIYGLQLPGVEIPPGSGATHLQQVLRALALYGEDQISGVSL